MNKKGIVITAVSLGVTAALIGGGIAAYNWYQDKNLTAETEYVSNLNWGYSGNPMSSYGMVTNDNSQNVFYLDEQIIKEIYVEEGQTVKAGDPLLAYDTTTSDLQLQKQELEINTTSNDLELAKRELEKLRNTTPVEPSPEPEEVPPQEEPEPEPEPDNPGPQKDGKAFNYITKDSKANKGKGTQDNPYIFLCTRDCYVLGAYLNSLAADKKNPVYARFEIHKDNDLEKKLVSVWEVSGESGLPQMADDSKWAVKTRTQVIEAPVEDPVDDVLEEPMEEPVEEEPKGYTAQELAKLISDKEKEIRDLDLEKRKQELELEQMKKVSNDGIVAATVNGTVKTVGDKDNPPTDGSAFIVVSGSEGLYVSGALSELMLGEIEVGQTVFANSWESGMSFEATITEISTYPKENSDAYSGDGNPNVSYYPYTAYIENTDGLKNGETVELTISNTAQNNDGIYLEKGYVRKENGKSYVLKAGKDNRLVKQYVETGQTLWGQAIEIVSGLTKEDRIAFPYGKTGKEGVKVEKDSSQDEM